MHTSNEARSWPAQTPTVTIHRPGEGEMIWFLDNLVTVKASARSGARFGLAESALPAGSETPLHRHHDDDESFYILEGTMTLFLEGGRAVEAGPGTFVHIPHGVAHGFPRAIGAHDARAVGPRWIPGVRARVRRRGTATRAASRGGSGPAASHRGGEEAPDRDLRTSAEASCVSGVRPTTEGGICPPVFAER